jgi:hypothetical protein
MVAALSRPRYQCYLLPRTTTERAMRRAAFVVLALAALASCDSSPADVAGKHTPATNGSPDCGALEGCVSSQALDGTRPPP